MKHYPLLPPLKEEGHIAIFEVAGAWHNRNPVELENISKSLNVVHPDANYSEIDSIPNMWARPLLFEMALYDTNHPIHQCVLGEWRGLLAMLALMEWRSFPLIVETIEIPPADDAGAPEFLQALRKLLPRHTLDVGTTWDQLYLILFKGKPIGLTSPTTLVCTASNYVAGIQGVPWFDGQYLCDPTDELSLEEKEAVAGWLRYLHDEKIDALPVLDPNLNEGFHSRIKDITDALKGLIHDFIDNLDATPGIQVALSDNGLGLTKGVFRGMNNPVKAKEMPSSVELVPSPAKSPKISILVADEAIASDWEVEPKNVVIWGPMTLATFPLVVKPRLPDNVDLRERKDFFTEKFFVIKQKDAFCGGLSPQGSDQIKFQGEDVAPILPIKDELLAYLDVTDLNERITFEDKGTGIVVKLRLTLSGIGGKNKDFVISKEYHFASGDVVPIPCVPVLEIWPNFKRSNWNVYYTYFTRSDQDTFDAKPLLSADGTFESKSFEITKTSSLPEAMLCEYKGTEAGVLLISVPETLPDGDGTWTIGVDFGTTSTTVYRNDHHDDPKEMEFGSRLLQVTNSGNKRSRLYDDFLSPDRQPTPFLSLFQSFPSSDKVPEEPLLDGHIYFLSDYKYLTGNIVTDLKWSPNPQVRNLTQVFLKQLCIQCAAEAVVEGAGEIRWRFSFPTAFSQADREQFQIIWSRVIDHCMTATGLLGGDVKSEPESIVTPKFFASTLQSESASGAFATGALCIDIGGETSDISIWQHNKLYWQTSLRLAGRHIFLDRIKKNPEFLKNFDVGSEDIELLKTKPDFYARADALIEKHGQDWLDDLAIKAGRPQVKAFVQPIAVGIAGLLYYVGLVLKYLGQNKEFESRMPSVYIGGNGSRILHWLANGQFKPDCGIRELLKQVILDASEFNRDDLFDLEISQSPKHEAAFGLVDAATILESKDEDQFGILAGEGFIEDTEKHDWTEILTTGRLVKGLRTTNNLEQIENFRKSFNKQTGWGKAIETPIELETNDNKFLLEQLQIQLQNLKDAGGEKLHIEPLFILALKLLLERKH